MVDGEGRKGKVAVFLVIGIVVALEVLGLLVYASNHNDRFKEATAIGLRNGVPVVLHARCGSPAPIGELEIREIAAGWQYPTDADPLIFSATSSGGSASELALTKNLPGYLVAASETLVPGKRYYLAAIWGPVKKEGSVAAEFTLGDLREGIAHPLEGPNKRDSGPDVALADWSASTTCS